MYRFALKKIEQIEGKLQFYKLFVNDVCEYDTFWVQCEQDGNLKSELVTLQARMQQLADLKTLPVEKHRDLTPKHETVKEYEIKTKHLRIYTFHDKENGRIIVLGGKKTNQVSDIKRFRNIKKAYFNNIKIC